MSTAEVRIALPDGFIDAVRHFVPSDQKLYTWWSYRNQDWRASNRGRRLDHIWVTRDLESSLVSQQVLQEARDWERTSDHVPQTTQPQPTSRTAALASTVAGRRVAMSLPSV